MHRRCSSLNDPKQTTACVLRCIVSRFDPCPSLMSRWEPLVEPAVVIAIGALVIFFLSLIGTLTNYVVWIGATQPSDG